MGLSFKILLYLEPFFSDFYFYCSNRIIKCIQMYQYHESCWSNQLIDSHFMWYISFCHYSFFSKFGQGRKKILLMSIFSWIQAHFSSFLDQPNIIPHIVQLVPAYKEQLVAYFRVEILLNLSNVAVID